MNGFRRTALAAAALGAATLAMPATALDDAFDERAALLEIRQIRGEERRVAALLGDRLGRGLAALAVATRDGDARPLGREESRDLLAQPRRRAGDDRDLAIEATRRTHVSLRFGSETSSDPAEWPPSTG